MFITYMFITIIWLLVIWLIKYNWSRRHLLIAGSKFDGPFALPFIGNALIFRCKTEDILCKVNKLMLDYANPMRFWLGPDLMIATSIPEHVQKILSSSKLVYKHELYDFLRIFIGEGLISSDGGPTYKQHRRILQPLFDLKFSTNQIGCFEKHTDVCVEKLKKYIEKEHFDVEPIIHDCVVDIIGEIILGMDMKAQTEGTNDFAQAMKDVYELLFERLIKVWLHPDMIFNQTRKKPIQDKIVRTIHGFAEEVIIESYTRRKLKKAMSSTTNEPIVDQIANYIEQNPNSISGSDFVDHLNTLYAASQDTITTIVSFTLMCFGMYPEYQQKAYEEMRAVLGNSPNITLEDINKLPYLDRCVNDVLRLFPIAPYIIRRTLDEMELDKWMIPKGVALIVPIFNLHYSPKQWENPCHFHPDHFLPVAMRQRHAYSFLPFSAGPRGCIGKIFSHLAIKVMLCKLLQSFEFGRDGKVPDVKLKMDISVRPIGGYIVKLRKREVDEITVMRACQRIT